MNNLPGNRHLKNMFYLLVFITFLLLFLVYRCSLEYVKLLHWVARLTEPLQKTKYKNLEKVIEDDIKMPNAIYKTRLKKEYKTLKE